MSRPEGEAAVVIVGAGPAGLSTAGALSHLGIAAVVLEQDGEIGARWVQRYDRLHLHTVRRFSGLAHHPLPRSLPRYVSKDDYARYLRDYAGRLALDVRCGYSVTSVRPSGACWRVETPDGSWRAPVVVLATGRHDRKFLPHWPGVERYRGRLMHSEEYRSAAALRGLDVLVAGLGNSGAEIAAALAEDGVGRVGVAVRTTPPISRRQVMGLPVQLLGIGLAPFPPRLVDAAGGVMRRISVGDLTRSGLGDPGWGPFTARRPPLIDVGFLRQLERGRIDVRPAVVRFSESSVVFADGRREEWDAVVAATGFRSGLPDLLELLGALDADGRPREDSSASHPGLYFVGFRDSVRGALFEINRDSRRVARKVAAYLRD